MRSNSKSVKDPRLFFPCGKKRPTASCIKSIFCASFETSSFLVPPPVLFSLAWKSLYHYDNASTQFWFCSILFLTWLAFMRATVSFTRFSFRQFVFLSAHTVLFCECHRGCSPCACKMQILPDDPHRMANNASILCPSSAVWCWHQSKYGNAIVPDDLDDDLIHWPSIKNPA